jgi:hypothetical protein
MAFPRLCESPEFDSRLGYLHSFLVFASGSHWLIGGLGERSFRSVPDEAVVWTAKGWRTIVGCVAGSARQGRGSYFLILGRCHNTDFLSFFSCLLISNVCHNKSVHFKGADNIPWLSVFPCLR